MSDGIPTRPSILRNSRFYRNAKQFRHPADKFSPRILQTTWFTHADSSRDSASGTPKRFGKIDTASPTACQLTWSLNNSNQRRDVDRNENHRNFCVLSSFASDYNYAQLSKGFSRATTCDAIFRLNEPYRLVSPTVSSVRFERTTRLRTDRR